MPYAVSRMYEWLRTIRASICSQFSFHVWNVSKTYQDCFRPRRQLALNSRTWERQACSLSEGSCIIRISNLPKRRQIPQRPNQWLVCIRGSDVRATWRRFLLTITVDVETSELLCGLYQLPEYSRGAVLANLLCFKYIELLNSRTHYRVEWYSKYNSTRIHHGRVTLY